MKKLLITAALISLFCFGCASSPDPAGLKQPDRILFAANDKTSSDTIQDNAPVGSGLRYAQNANDPGAENQPNLTTSDENNLSAKDELEQLLAGEEVQTIQVPDPIEPWNRLWFEVNDDLIIYALEPVAKGYKKVVPDDFRLAIKNFFRNLGTPVRFVSSVLQGNAEKAGNELGSFLINSTLGVFGLGTPAQEVYGLKTTDEDLGQALGSKGVGHGFYIVWPIVGPSSLRDTVGMAGGYFLDPITYFKPTELSFGLRTLDAVNSTSFHIGDYESLKGFSIDPYESLRDAYLQRRAKQVKD